MLKKIKARQVLCEDSGLDYRLEHFSGNGGASCSYDLQYGDRHHYFSQDTRVILPGSFPLTGIGFLRSGNHNASSSVY